MNIKRVACGLCAAMMLAAVATGCGSSTSSAAASSESAAASSASGLNGTVATGGSTSMEKVMSALQEAYAEKEPDVTVTYDPTGSGAGITGATDKTLDIGLSSRKLKDGETGVTATTIALDGIAIIVNNANPV